MGYVFTGKDVHVWSNKNQSNKQWTECLYTVLLSFFLAVVALCRVHGLSLVAPSGGFSWLRWAGFPLRRPLILLSTGSALQWLQCVDSVIAALGLSSTVSVVVTLGFRPGIELVSLALQGRFLTIEPPGKPISLLLNKIYAYGQRLDHQYNVYEVKLVEDEWFFFFNISAHINFCVTTFAH